MKNDVWVKRVMNISLFDVDVSNDILREGFL